MRVLCWDRDVLYASRGYEVFATKVNAEGNLSLWNFVGCYHCGLARTLTCATRLTSRLFRDGFHALAVLSPGHLFAAVPGRIIRLMPGDREFHSCHRVLRGTRPLHITVGPNDQLLFGEYFDNRERREVHIFGSSDRGENWDPIYTFPAGSIRHVHNIVFDEWTSCYWILTGDEAHECQIIRASLDFRTVETVIVGGQQARAATLVHCTGAASDAPRMAAGVGSLPTSPTHPHLSTTASSTSDATGHVDPSPTAGYRGRYETPKLEGVGGGDRPGAGAGHRSRRGRVVADTH